MSIIGGIIFLFIATSLIASYVNSEFDSSLPENNINNFEGEIETRADESSTNAWRAFGSIFAMFFWSFGALPVWLDLIFFLPIRIIFWLTLIRNVWIGGGS